MIICSCRPNAFVHFDLATFSLQLRAIKTIAPGEEIVVSYVPLNESIADRQRTLEHYGFQCSCAACTNPDSDLRRKYLLASLELKPPPQTNVLDHVLVQIRLLEQEGLESTLLYLEYLGTVPYERARRGDSAWLVLRDVFRLYSCTLATQGMEEGVRAVHRCRAKFASMLFVSYAVKRCSFDWIGLQGRV